MKIAIFDSYSLFREAPEGCPKEYVNDDFQSRKAFAEWLENYGEEYLSEKRDEISVYVYEKSWRDKLFGFRVAVVPVDIHRPWLLHWFEGREKIWYLDQKDEWNQVTPDIQPKLVSFGFTGDSCVIRK